MDANQPVLPSARVATLPTAATLSTAASASAVPPLTALALPPRASNHSPCRLRIVKPNTVGRKRERAAPSKPEEDDEDMKEEEEEEKTPTPAAPAPVPVPARRYISAAEAAAHEGLPVGVVQGWMAQGLIVTLKAGPHNSRRLVDRHSLREHMELELQREHARAANLRRMGRRPRQPSSKDEADQSDDDSDHEQQPESERCRRTLLYVRMRHEAVIDGDPAAAAAVPDGHDVTERSPQQQRALVEIAQWLERAAHIADPATRSMEMDVGVANDLSRPGFQRVLKKILQRQVDSLILISHDQVCDPGSWPLFELLCQLQHVTIRCVTESVPATGLPGMLA